MQDFSEGAQCQVLDFMSRYRPVDSDEVYDIMNALDDRLATPNSAVVLATVRVFLNMTLSMPYDHQQALSFLPPPFLHCAQALARLYPHALLIAPAIQIKTPVFCIWFQ